MSFQTARDRIATARFRAFGCPHLVAAASWTVDRLTGAPVSQAAQWDWLEVAAAVQVPPAKYGRLLTLQDAIRAACRNWPGITRSTV